MYRIYGIMYIPEQRIVYVGQTYLTLENRFANHIQKAYRPDKDYNNQIGDMIKENRIHDFDIVLIEDCIETKEKADEREQYWIKVYDTYHNGCNGTLGGKGTSRFTKDDKNNMVYQYENGTNIKKIAKEYDTHQNVIRKILRQERGIPGTHINGLQPPPFYIYNLPWDIIIPNDNSQPLQIF